MYQQRVNALKGKAGASQDKIEKVEKDLAGLNKKINELLDITNITANEYYESVYLGNAYSILVPPSSSALNTTKNVLDSSMEVLLIAEALILVIYIMAAFCTALLQDTKKAHAEKVAGGKEAKSSDEEDDEKDTSEK